MAVTGPPARPRSGHATVVHKGGLYVFGGTVEANIQLNDLYMLSFEPETADVDSNSLSEHFSTMVNNSEFSDVQFTVEGEVIYAHKLVLSARSDHFRALFGEK